MSATLAPIACCAPLSAPTITDEEAAATQARVEAIEKERQRLEAQGVPPAEAAARAADTVAQSPSQPAQP